jgi:hypothetical protein
MDEQNQEERLTPLEQGLLQAMKAIDKQIARGMQRTPAEREEKGVVKGEEYSTRIERITTFLLNAFNDGQVELDAFLVLSQALVKSFTLTVEDLGRDGLGEIRSSYCDEATRLMSRDLLRIEAALRTEPLN